jgi:predicted nucleic-acid-binding Zn-ribbon protein
MGHFIFRCPATGFNVQHRLDDDPDVSENEYEAVTCLSCNASGFVRSLP